MSSQDQISIERSFQYGSKKIPYILIHHERKNLRIEVSPSLEVFVKAPLWTPEELIDKSILKKASWITKQFIHFEQFYPKITPRKYISWETFFYLGKQYILKIEMTIWKQYITLFENYIIVYVKEIENAKKLINKRYLECAKNRFPSYTKKIIEEFRKKYGILPQSVKIRTMLTRRWSCSKKWNITLNSELVKAPRWCIEYVIIHELCHLLEFNHTRAFYELQAKEMPDRQKRKNKLEKMLA